jgi:hypothetical protein
MFYHRKPHRSLAALRHLRSNRPHLARPRRSNLSGYRIEGLEERLVLSTITWNNPHGGDWDTASNWTGGVLPGPNDSAVINIAGITITHNAAAIDVVGSLTSKAALALSAGSLALGSASTITNTLTLAGGTLTGAGALKVNSLLWSIGTMSGPGTTTVVAGGTMTLRANGSRLLDGRTLTNAGTATWSGAGNLDMADGAALNNLVGATFSVLGSAAIAQTGGAASSFTNAGTFQKATQAGNTAIGVPFTNTGTISVQTGSLTFLADGTTTGKMALSAGSSVVFSGDSVAFGPGETVTGAGTMSITNAATITVTGTNTVSNLSMNSGTLTGPGTLTATGKLTWSGGTMSGSGTTVAQGGLAIGGTAPGIAYLEFLSGRTLVNDAAATLSSTLNLEDGYYSGLFLGDGATLVNQAGASFDITGDVPFLADSSSSDATFDSAIVNYGAFDKTGGAGASAVSYPYNYGSVAFDEAGSGSVEVMSGELDLDGGGTLGGTGRLTADAGAVLGFGGGTFAVTPTSGLAGAGSVAFHGGTLTDQGAYDIATATIVDGGTADLLAPVASLGASLLISGGELNLSGGAPVSVSSLVESGGTLTGSDALTVSGQATWSGGTMSGSGTTVAQGGLAIGGTAPDTAYLEFLSGRTLVNDAAATLSSTLNLEDGYYSGLFLGDGATLVNQAVRQRHRQLRRLRQDRRRRRQRRELLLRLRLGGLRRGRLRLRRGDVR